MERASHLPEKSQSYQPTQRKFSGRDGGGSAQTPPAPAQMGQKPGSATSQPEKVQRDILVRWDGLLVPCSTDVAAVPLGARTLRQFRETSMDLELGDSS